jgi:hypothetical protein
LGRIGRFVSKAGLTCLHPPVGTGSKRIFKIYTTAILESQRSGFAWFACALNSDETALHRGGNNVTENASEHPASSPPSVVLQFNRPWTMLRPRLYRSMPAQFVDAFFKDGSLRLSSFAQFAKHPNEQMQDPHEGRGMRVGVGPNLTLMSHHGRGGDCYVLCGTLNNTSDAKKLFKADSCFVIDDITSFANAVSTKIPFVGGLEGFAIYQDDTTIMKSLGSLTAADFGNFKNPDGTFAGDAMMKTVGGPEEFFIKRSRFAAECEYRVLWMTGQPVSSFIDIKVPEAIPFCRQVALDVQQDQPAQA